MSFSQMAAPVAVPAVVWKQTGSVGSSSCWAAAPTGCGAGAETQAPGDCPWEETVLIFGGPLTCMLDILREPLSLWKGELQSDKRGQLYQESIFATIPQFCMTQLTLEFSLQSCCHSPYQWSHSLLTEVNNWNILSQPNINNVKRKTGTGPGEGLPRIGKKTHVT